MPIVDLHNETMEFVYVRMDDKEAECVRDLYVQGWRNAVLHKNAVNENAGIGRLDLLLKLLADDSFDENNPKECSDSTGKLILKQMWIK